MKEKYLLSILFLLWILAWTGIMIANNIILKLLSIAVNCFFAGWGIASIASKWGDI